MNKPSDAVFRDVIEKWRTKLVKRPTLGEYPVYDEHLYQYMIDDAIRMRAYEMAITKHAPGKTVVEIGTGSQAPLALMCARAGAKKVYAIEVGEIAARSAREIIANAGFSDVIEVVVGISKEIELPERVDLCVSEIIGMIGSAEGVISILSDARRFLKPGGQMIPRRCWTLMVPVTHPDDVYTDEDLDAVHHYYTDAIRRAVDEKLEFSRFAFFNFPESLFLSSPRPMEDMDFSHDISMPMRRFERYSIARDGVCDGLLNWIELYVDDDLIVSGWRGTSWAPVFIAVDPFQVLKGDRLDVATTVSAAPGAINPDYRFSGRLHRADRLIHDFEVSSWWSAARGAGE